MREAPRVRPFLPSDVGAVASLYERVVRSGKSVASSALQAAFHSLFVSSPLVSREIPPLVLESSSGLLGFQGVHVRRTTSGHVLASLGPLFVAPEARASGQGLQILSRVLQGSQQLTYSDGASEEARRLWERLGGSCSNAHSLEWVLPLRPLTTVLRLSARGRNRNIAATLSSLRPIAYLGDLLVSSRWHRKLEGKPAVGVLLEEIQIDEWLAFLDLISNETDLNPVFTPDIASWTVKELKSLKSRGDFKLLGAKRNGKIVGTASVYLSRDATLSVMQLCGLEKHRLEVMVALIRYCKDRGVVAIEGRMDAGMKGIAGNLPLFYQRSTPFLVHSRDSVLLDRFVGLGSRFSRLDGEWVMNLRMEAYP
jgi:hypothetical protein